MTRLWGRERLEAEPVRRGLSSPRRDNEQPGPNAGSLGMERKELSQ